MTWKSVPFALMLLGTALPSHAARIATDLTEFENKSRWTMFQSFKDDYCAIAVSYAKETNLLMSWYPRGSDLSIAIYDPVLESIKENSKYDIEVFFTKGSTRDDGWGTRHATGVVDANHIPGFLLALNGPEALTDLASSSGMSFWYKSKLVESLDLAGTALAVSELRRCSAEIVKNHPIDPFED